VAPFAAPRWFGRLKRCRLWAVRDPLARRRRFGGRLGFATLHDVGWVATPQELRDNNRFLILLNVTLARIKKELQSTTLNSFPKILHSLTETPKFHPAFNYVFTVTLGMSALACQTAVKRGVSNARSIILNWRQENVSFFLMTRKNQLQIHLHLYGTCCSSSSDTNRKEHHSIAVDRVNHSVHR
jgi:hypothetical protein